MTRARLAARALRLLLMLVVALLLAEASLRIVDALRDRPAPTALARVNQLLGGPSSWEQRFSERYADGEFVYESLHQSHPTRGWALIPGLHAHRGDITYTTNSDGFRSLHDFSNDPARYQVLILGDSFTFGDGIDDAVTWPQRLEERNARLNVLNLAGTGYAPDQMYLTLKEAIGRYRPSLVVAAFISDDLARSLLPFRDFKKPRFVLRNSELVLTNTPIGSPAEVFAEVHRKAARSRLQIVNAARALAWRFSGSESSCGPDECVPLNTRIFEAIRQTSAEHGAAFLMVYLPFGREMAEAAFQREGEDFFKTYRERHARDVFFDARPELLAASFDKAPGHYTDVETRRIAAMIDREIRALPSWAEFAAPRRP